MKLHLHETKNHNNFRFCTSFDSHLCQNIDNNVATADDYILKAKCQLSLKNETDSDLVVLNLINIAKELDKDNINIYKTEIIALLRLDNKREASELLNQYIATLSTFKLDDIKSGYTWDQTNNFINEERDWVDKMRIKLRGM